MPDYDHMRNGWNGHMMGDGSTWTPWMVVLLVVTTLLLVAVAVLAARAFGSRRPAGLPGSGRPIQGSEPPEEMLDRLFAAGEIDEATYRARRTALAEMRPPARA
ncbi:MAG: SHOCT domain-containing protein [Actinobacteria bacterium]|nr:SHOCT domain-containing protein [Actinomycetota bacterium]